MEFISPSISSAFKNYPCQECGSSLITTQQKSEHAETAKFECRSCGNTENYEEIVNDAVYDYFYADTYLSITDGGEPPVIDCPLCNDGVYLLEEGLCAACGDGAIHECQRCGCDIPPEELSDGEFCGYCSHLIEKVMNE